MVYVTYISRASDGLIFVETWNRQSLDSQFAEAKRQAKQLMVKLGVQDQTCSIEAKSVTFHVVVDEGVVYLVAADTRYPKKFAFSFLSEVKTAFKGEYPNFFGSTNDNYFSEIQRVNQPYAFIRFERVIRNKLSAYKQRECDGSLHRLNDSLEEVTHIMKKNIDEILHRGENLDDVGKKANDLKFASEKFRKMAKRLSFKALVQQYAPLAVLVIFLLVIIAWKLFL